MSKKRTKWQESPGGAAPRMKEPVGRNRAAAKEPAARSLSARHKVIAGLVLVTMLIATTGILAQRGKNSGGAVRNLTERVYGASSPAPTAANGQQSAEMSPESLSSPSLWSKEYIHGPGGGVIATEERLAFTDVVDGSQFYDDIYRIAARGVTLGCAPSLYCPDPRPDLWPSYGYVTRQEMAAFIMRALGEFNPPTPPTQRFADVPPSNIFYNFIDRLAVLGVTVGCGTDAGGHPIYCPTDLVTHEQMAAFMDRAIGVPNPPTPPAQPTFCDVPTTNIFYAHIEYYANSRSPIIWPGCGGVGSGTSVCGTSCSTGRCFCPGDHVTRRQMAHILVKAFGI